jgi:hypothetical protein
VSTQTAPPAPAPAPWCCWVRRLPNCFAGAGLPGGPAALTLSPSLSSSPAAQAAKVLPTVEKLVIVTVVVAAGGGAYVFSQDSELAVSTAQVGVCLAPGSGERIPLHLPPASHEGVG